MKSSTRIGGVGALCLLFVASGTVRWRNAVPPLERRMVSFGEAGKGIDAPPDSMLARAEDLTVSNDPFRLGNAPADVRFDPRNENGNQVGVPPVPMLRPTLSLKAIVGGPPWQAIVDGIPGQPPGTQVRAGATFDKLVARSVTRDSVVIQGPDTTWVLSFRRMP